MRFEFQPVYAANIYRGNKDSSWKNWSWQMQNLLTTEEDFSRVFDLTAEEKAGFQKSRGIFRVAATPYYASLAAKVQEGLSDLGQLNPLRRIMMPLEAETQAGAQQMEDPLAEVEHNPVGRIIHRYSDRVLFLVTDICSVYCRFCTRKRFTGHDHGFVKRPEYYESLDYIRRHPGIREVIFSGGDPLTLSNSVLKSILKDIRAIPHIEVIRIGSRMPVVCPMRIDEDLAQILRAAAPVYLMTHFSHPKELTQEAKEAITLLVDHGVPLLNQMVLLNGVNNHAAIIQALNRRLLYLRVKPYYMFQCDPSEGTDHLRTTIENSESIVKELWGHLSGLAMPALSLDIPAGGGKTTLVPDFTVKRSTEGREYIGWDGRKGAYKNPQTPMSVPADLADYQEEWETLRNSKRIEVSTHEGPSKPVQDERNVQQTS